MHVQTSMVCNRYDIIARIEGSPYSQGLHAVEKSFFFSRLSAE